jgi:hypothetical protein
MSQAIAALDRAFPNFVWERAGAIAADVTGDATAELIIPGKSGERFVVGIVEGPVSAGSRVWLLAFDVGKQTQDSLCGTAVTLSAEEPRLPLAELGCGVGVEGDGCTDYRAIHEWFRDHVAAHGIRVDDGMCDSFHLYWHSAKSTFDWWRL